MIGNRVPPGLIALSRAALTTRRLLVTALILGSVLLLLEIYLVILLRSLDAQARQAADRVALAQAALLRAADAVERGPIEVPIQLEADLPVQTSLRVQQTVQFPVQTEIPLNTTLQVPVNTPVGSFNLPVPLNLTVPIDTQVPVAIDQEIPISTTVPIQIDQAISIDLRGTELGAELRRLRRELESGR